MMRWSVWSRRQSMGWSSALAVGVWLIAANGVQAQDVPFEGVVVQDEVIVRAGAGNAYYEVGRLERGASVRVEEVLYGWNRIQPPEGVYSYVSKMNVDARGDGRVGEVNSNRVDVTAANVAGPGQSYRRQVVLNEGDVVRIVDEAGSFYKIEPPANAPVYLPPGSIRRADSEEAIAVRRELEQQDAAPADTDVDDVEADEQAPSEQAQQAQQVAQAAANDEGVEVATAADADPDADAEADADADAAGQAQVAGADDEPAAEGDAAETSEAAQADAQADAQLADAQDAQAEAQARMAEADAREAEAIETPAVSAELREVERRNMALAMQPLEDQPIEQMIAEYQQVRDEVPDLPAMDQRIIQMRLAALERNQQLAATLTQIRDARRASEQRQTQAAEAEAEADAAFEPVRLTDRPSDYYDASGRLLASGVYDGRTLPRLFRLVDPGSGRTIAYIKPDDAVQPHRVLGRLVGVRGRREYNQALQLYVFNVRQIDVLEAVQQ